MFSRIRSTGLWTISSTVDPAEWEAFDENQSNAVDGAGGGAYSFADDLVFGGAPGVVVQVDCEFDTTGPVFHLGPVTFQDAANFFEDVNVFASLLVSGDFLTVQASSFFEEDVTVDAATILNGDLTVNGQITLGAGFDDDLFVNAATGFYNGVTFHEPVDFAGDGKICHRSVTLSVDANQSIRPAICDTFHIPNSVLTANRDITIDDTGAQDGMRIVFKTKNTTRAVAIRIPGGALLGGLTGIANIIGVYNWVEAERIDGVWELLRQGPILS